MKYLIALVFLLASTAMAAEEAEAKRGKHKHLVIEPVSEEVCQQIRDAVATYGIAIVEAGAAALGYTKVQIDRARAHCK